MFSTAIRYKLEGDLGCRVTHCPSFAALKEELSRPDNDFALAILDLNQADGPDGEALDFVLARGMKPIVFTGHFGSDVRESALNRNAADFVVKGTPGSIDLLVASVDRILTAAQPQVMIVGFETELLLTLSDILADAGYASHACETVDAALSLLDERRGVEMALVQGDGVLAGEFLSEVARRHGEGIIRSIGLAERGASDLAASFLKLGGEDFMHWPGEASELIGRLNRMLAWHQQVRLLKRMASRDYLTDLFNRRYFFDRGPKLVEQCLRQERPVAAVILDIDHFKRLNDTYGHEIGDVVLKSIARKLRAIVGEDDHLLARLGGEEFGMILTGMDIKTANEFCDMVRQEIARTRIVVEEEDLAVTISMGLAEITELETFDNYLNAADQYLYMAKHSGRNRVFSDYQVLQSAAKRDAA